MHNNTTNVRECTCSSTEPDNKFTYCYMSSILCDVTIHKLNMQYCLLVKRADVPDTIVSIVPSGVNASRYL